MKQSTYINNFVDHSATSGTLQTQIDTHEADTTSIHGITDTADLALYSVLASVVDSSEGSTLIGYKDNETIKEILDDIVNSGVLDTITLSDDGGLNVSWSVGEVYDQTNGNIIVTISGSDTCTDNNVNYLKWVSGTSLTLATTRPDIGTGEVGVGHFHAVDGDIIGGGGHTEDILSKRETTMSDALSQMFPTIVTTGLLISEHAGDGTWDVDSTAGIYFHNGHTRYDVSTIDSTVTLIVRHFHSGGVWATDTNSQIDPTQYDNGTNLVAVTANQHYRSVFVIDPDDVIHWIYPQTNYGTVAAAVEGVDPTIPGGLEGFPKSVAIVLRGNAAAFPLASSDQWIDVRPTLTTAQAASISDHGNLTGLSDNDHPQYLLDADFTTYSGTLQTQITTNTGNISTNTSDISALDTKIDTTSGTLQTQTDDITAKTDYITVTTAVDLDKTVLDTDFTSSGIMRRLDASGSYDVIDPDHLHVTTSGDVGVHTKTPVEALGVNGAINLGTTTKTNVGTIRYTGSDFEGYHSSSWLSLTKPTLSKSISVEYPTDSENISMFFTPVAITVTEMRAVVSGTLPSVTWTVKHHTNNKSSSGNEVVTSGTITTSTTTGSDVTSFDDATIITDSFVWFETTTQSGTVDELHVTLIYTED